MQFSNKIFGGVAALALAAGMSVPALPGAAVADSVQPAYTADTLMCIKMFFEDPAAHAQQCAGSPTGSTGSLIDSKGSDGVDCSPGDGPDDEEYNASDVPCLKYDVTLLHEVDGLRFYSFKYIGDDHVYYGVNARELLEDPRYAFAVKRVAGGYYAVNYGALGLLVPEDAAMHAAGQRAMELVAARYQS